MAITREDIIMVLKDVKHVIETEWDLDDNIYENGMNGTESVDFAAECVERAIKLITKM